MDKTHFDLLVAEMTAEQIAQIDNELTVEEAGAYARTLLLGWLVSGYAVTRDLTVFPAQACRIVRDAAALASEVEDV